MICLQCQKAFDLYSDASIVRGRENPWEMFCSDECVKTYDYFKKHPWPTQEKHPFCHVCEDHHGPEGGKSTACSNFNPHLEPYLNTSHTDASWYIMPESPGSPATKMNLTKYEDDLKNTVDGWDEEWCAAVYLHLYRRGMRVDKAEGIVDKMKRRKD